MAEILTHEQLARIVEDIFGVIAIADSEDQTDVEMSYSTLVTIVDALGQDNMAQVLAYMKAAPEDERFAIMDRASLRALGFASTGDTPDA